MAARPRSAQTEARSFRKLWLNTVRLPTGLPFGLPRHQAATSGHSHVCLAQVPFLLFPSVMGVNFSALHIIDPLIAGALLGAGWTAGPIMTVTACGRSLSSCSACGSLGGGWKASPPTRPRPRRPRGHKLRAGDYAVSTVRPTIRPARKSSSAACASPSGRLRVGIGPMSSLAPNRAARAPPRACRSACLRWSSP